VRQGPCAADRVRRKQVSQQEITDLLEFLTQRGKYLPIPLAKAAYTLYRGAGDVGGLFHGNLLIPRLCGAVGIVRRERDLT
jgi:hypothetical protein